MSLRMKYTKPSTSLASKEIENNENIPVITEAA